MTWGSAAAVVIVPDGTPEPEALARVTHLGIGAHPDDLEIMTWHGIAHGRDDPPLRFGGVVVADGADSPRDGRYANVSREEMRAVRLEEQRRAAELGGYAALVALGYESAAFKQALNPALVRDLGEVLTACAPEVVYTHNPCDRHDTHVAVVMHVLEAARALPAAARPKALYGCEVWGSLDWLTGPERVAFAVSRAEELGVELVAVFESQVAGGKRYDLAALGRRHANATFGEPREVDRETAVELAMDLSPLVHDPSLDMHAYIAALWERSGDAVLTRLRRFRT